jgi:hypothetical protein
LFSSYSFHDHEKIVPKSLKLKLVLLQLIFFFQFTNIIQIVYTTWLYIYIYIYMYLFISIFIYFILLTWMKECLFFHPQIIIVHILTTLPILKTWHLLFLNLWLSWSL